MNIAFGRARIHKERSHYEQGGKPVPTFATEAEGGFGIDDIEHALFAVAVLDRVE
ncbi:hypothetical protein [Devosia limi]|uniref:Uncharacterized protein n=1 Tax=Devosia limi DSM 17137 TaxID=1121477 RepID=A0A1M5CTS2_9HYPH|nr:hypothetical protein [Devosia limi]SHF58076.1 hypothetical protein SAMN02745223_03053 [Devosia limi DSM 17137]